MTEPDYVIYMSACQL